MLIQIQTVKFTIAKYTAPKTAELKSENDGVDYSYIDLLAIVQVIKSEDYEEEGC